MEIEYGTGTTEFGPGVNVKLTADEVALAIDAYLVAHGVYLRGPRTIRDGMSRLVQPHNVYVDPSGHVIHDGDLFSGRGPKGGA